MFSTDQIRWNCTVSLLWSKVEQNGMPHPTGLWSNTNWIQPVRAGYHILASFNIPCIPTNKKTQLLTQQRVYLLHNTYLAPFFSPVSGTVRPPPHSFLHLSSSGSHLLELTLSHLILSFPVRVCWWLILYVKSIIIAITWDIIYYAPPLKTVSYRCYIFILYSNYSRCC